MITSKAAIYGKMEAFMDLSFCTQLYFLLLNTSFNYLIKFWTTTYEVQKTILNSMCP